MTATMKSIISLYLLPALGVACLLGSCSNERVDNFFKKIIQAPPSEIERDVKGHDQIYAVHAILRMGYKAGQIGVGANADEMVDVYGRLSSGPPALDRAHPNDLSLG